MLAQDLRLPVIGLIGQLGGMVEQPKVDILGFLGECGLMAKCDHSHKNKGHEHLLKAFEIEHVHLRYTTRSPTGTRVAREVHWPTAVD